VPEVPSQILDIADRLGRNERLRRRSVETLLKWFGAARRGDVVVSKIRAALHSAGLETDPDFAQGTVKDYITFHLVATHATTAEAVPAQMSTPSDESSDDFLEPELDDEEQRADDDRQGVRRGEEGVAIVDNIEALFVPLVRGNTTTLSMNVASFMDQFADGIYYVPDYQRDSSQWDFSKRSLFIESLINNITVPPLIAYFINLKHEIVDGQQRVTTVRDYMAGKFSLALQEEADYRENVGPLIQGKTFEQLPKSLQKQIRQYVLNFASSRSRVGDFSRF
jgi:hypothetical protein